MDRVEADPRSPNGLGSVVDVPRVYSVVLDRGSRSQRLESRESLRLSGQGNPYTRDVEQVPL
jgi:hypothetical protein